jgi:D-lyxose ketol-isomerase
VITKEQWLEARDRSVAMLEQAGIALTSEEREHLEVADFGLGRLDEIGLEIVTYVNTDRVCAKEIILFPWQICPEHIHPPVQGQPGGQPGKEETFRCRWGTVYLYVSGPASDTFEGRLPQKHGEHLTVRNQIVLQPGDQYTLLPETWHWFQGGPEGAIVSEFSTHSTDEADIFRDPAIARLPVVK